MNIFIMVLVFLFMAGYYFMDSPNQVITEQVQDYAINRTDLRSIAECTASEHTAVINGSEFHDICVKNYDIKSHFICLNDRLAITNCEIVRGKKPAFSFIITSAIKISEKDYNNMLEIQERYYPDAGTFGVFMDDFILAGGANAKRTVPQTIIKKLALEPGQTIYMTQYEIPDIQTDLTTPESTDIKCPSGSIKSYKFGKWQCINYNEKTNCTGDNIWDSDTGECIPDDARKPLCSSEQTAVMVDDVWQCLDPFQDKNCPGGMVARLNYSTLEWECISDPKNTINSKKCSPSLNFSGKLGSTLQIPTTSCTDCEEMVTDMETCVSVCVPSATKLNDPKCYPNPSSCTGSNRAFYFGFPNTSYVANVSAVSGMTVPFDIMHSQNRKFNCLECINGNIDTTKSKPPFIAVCE